MGLRIKGYVAPAFELFGLAEDELEELEKLRELAASDRHKISGIEIGAVLDENENLVGHFAVIGKEEVFNNDDPTGGPPFLDLSTGRGMGTSALIDFMEDAASRGLKGAWTPEDYPEYIYWLEVK